MGTNTQQIRIGGLTLENDTFWSFSTISMRLKRFSPGIFREMNIIREMSDNPEYISFCGHYADYLKMFVFCLATLR